MDNSNKKENLNKRISTVKLSIASSDQIREWSNGEVLKPETINYKTYKSEKDGLFCELIFGTTKNYRCPNCMKKHKRIDEGKLCPNCGEVKITSSAIRRRRMGHIELKTPVTHIWFAKVDYSMIRLLLDLKQTILDGIIYFKSHIIIDVNNYAGVKHKEIINIQNAPKAYRKIMRQMLLSKDINDEDKLKIKEKISELEDYSQSQIGQDYGIDFYEYNWFIEKYSNITIDTGARALKRLLENIDLKAEKKNILQEIKSKKDKNKLFRRLKVVEAFLNSGQNPADMIMTAIPIIPVDLRPLVQLDGGRHSSADVNELYRRIIIRNNRLKEWINMEAPELIVQNEKRMIQESVDALFDNQRKKLPVESKDRRVLKSLSENLKGKQGRFRQNLLGKRVDYSGRSVIVGGPTLKINQVGIPKEMIAKLFEPFIVNLLIKNNIAPNIKRAKKLIEAKDDRIWKYANEIIKERPVLLNRAPTLHRLSIQAFQPVITNDKAIRIHPLVTTPFNADFDGDQMAVYVPISERSKKEAFELMESSKNILGPKDGKLIITPSQDIVLGIYYLTKHNNSEPGSGNVYGNYHEVMKALHNKYITLHSSIAFSTKTIEAKIGQGKTSNEYPYILTTPGKVIFNNIFPDNVPYINEGDPSNLKELSTKFLFKYGTDLRKECLKTEEIKPLKQKQISLLIETIYPTLRNEISDILNEIKNIGMYYSTMSGISISIGDIIDVPEKDELIKQGDTKVKQLTDYYTEGMINDDERYLEVIDVWSTTKDKIQEKLDVTLSKEPDNSLYMMMDSGARGNLSNFVQLTCMRGLMSKAIHIYAALKRQNILIRTIEEIPIKSSFKFGLSTFEFYISTNGARKGLSDTATKTSESGYLTRRLVDAVQDITIKEADCGISQGFDVTEIKDNKLSAMIIPLYDRIVGRNSNENVKDKDGKTLVKKGDMISKDIANQIVDAGIETVNIRSVLSCKTKRGVCQKCYGVDLTNGEEVNIGEAVGIISAQSIGEPGTQLTMRTFHTGGVAGVSDITQGFSRLLELVDANKNPKSAAKIARISGEVVSIEKVIKSEKKKQITQIVIKNDLEEITHDCSMFDILRVKKGQEVVAGEKLTDGSIKLQELLEYAGQNATKKYLIKEIQKVYRLQGIDISDKYMEIIIRQMFSKVIIITSGSTKMHPGAVVSLDRFREEIDNSIAAGKKDLPLAKPIILGVKPLPLYSESFLAAASYQRTAEALVSAAINNKTDHLRGVKENLIIGKQIPVGTGIKNPQGKYDIFKDIIIQEAKDAEREDSYHEAPYIDFEDSSAIKSEK